MRRGDLPAGWKSDAYQPDAGDKADQAALVRCVGARDTDSDKTGEAHSPNFYDRNASVSSEAERYRSDRDLAIDEAVLRSPRTIPCYRKLSTPARLGLPNGSKITSISFHFSGHLRGQPTNVIGGLQAVISAVVSGQKAVLYEDAAFVIGRRIEAEVDFSNVGTRVPTAFRAALTATVAARAARA